MIIPNAERVGRDKIRSTKSKTNSNEQNSKYKVFWAFERSNFGIRYSDFSMSIFAKNVKIFFVRN